MGSQNRASPARGHRVPRSWPPRKIGPLPSPEQVLRRFKGVEALPRAISVFPTISPRLASHVRCTQPRRSSQSAACDATPALTMRHQMRLAHLAFRGGSPPPYRPVMLPFRSSQLSLSRVSRASYACSRVLAVLALLRCRVRVWPSQRVPISQSRLTSVPSNTRLPLSLCASTLVLAPPRAAPSRAPLRPIVAAPLSASPPPFSNSPPVHLSRAHASCL